MTLALDLELRPITADEWPAFARVAEHAFGAPDDPEYAAWDREALRPELTLAAFDRGEAVGTSGAFRFGISAPGAGPVPSAGVTFVAVLPTHRRRGILRALMTRQLTDLAATGPAIAALWASQSGIYQRFGYGLASQAMLLRIPRGAPFRADASVDVGLRPVLVEPADCVAEVESLHAAELWRRPGLVERDEAWARRQIILSATERHGGSTLRAVLVQGSAGTTRAAARYYVQPEWVEGVPGGTVHVREAYALDAAACSALWRYLLDLDLMSTVVARSRPVDDPVLHLLADPRPVKPIVRDALFVRLVDVPAALASRRYACDVDVVVDVRDALLPDNTGLWRLTGGLDGATCARTSEPADLQLGVTDLGAAFHGAVTLTALAMAGRVTELRPGSLARASAAFSWAPAPWTPTFF